MSSLAVSRQIGGTRSSAVCAFSLKDIERAFEGKYKELNKETSRWTIHGVPDDISPRPGSVSIPPNTHPEQSPSPPETHSALIKAPMVASEMPVGAGASASPVCSDRTAHDRRVQPHPSQSRPRPPSSFTSDTRPLAERPGAVPRAVSGISTAFLI